MKVLLICLLFISSTCSSSNNFRKVYTFEFGVDMGHLTFAASGYLDPYNYFIPTHVRVKVPSHSRLTYVRVQVASETRPDVFFDWAAQVVSINRRPSHFLSKDWYKVTAKSLPL